MLELEAELARSRGYSRDGAPGLPCGRVWGVGPLLPALTLAAFFCALLVALSGLRENAMRRSARPESRTLRRTG